MSNKNLGAARRAKNDDFFTGLSDIEDELKHYAKHFKGKTVFCNCDDPMQSNFTLYFLMHFNGLRLKRLISTGTKVFSEEKTSGRRKTLCLDVSEVQEVIDSLKAQGNTAHITANMRTLYIRDKDGSIRRPYGRIIIRRIPQ